MSADITKFYNQFQVQKDHVDYQRLLWRENPHIPVQEYRLKCVTFGVTSAPYLAIRCLHQLADDESVSCPFTTRVIKEDFLVDNLLSGAPDVGTALKLQSNVLHVMEKGKLELRKWASNYEEVLQPIPHEFREAELSLSIKDQAFNTIGLLWYPSSDSFGVSIVVPDINSQLTKSVLYLKEGKKCWIVLCTLQCTGRFTWSWSCPCLRHLSFRA